MPLVLQVGTAMKNGANAAREPGTAQALLTQHRELLALLERIEALCRGELLEPSRSQLKIALQNLIEALVAHLQAEHDSIDRDFEDVPELRAAFIELDKDHPNLLAGFTEALATLRSGQPAEVVRERVERAIVAFRGHEESEDALFASYS